MSDFDLVVSGKVVLTDRIIDGGYVAVKDGKISAIGKGKHRPASSHMTSERAW